MRGCGYRRASRSFPAELFDTSLLPISTEPVRLRRSGAVDAPLLHVLPRRHPASRSATCCSCGCSATTSRTPWGTSSFSSSIWRAVSSPGLFTPGMVPDVRCAADRRQRCGRRRHRRLPDAASARPASGSWPSRSSRSGSRPRSRSGHVDRHSDRHGHVAAGGAGGMVGAYRRADRRRCARDLHAAAGRCRYSTEGSRRPDVYAPRLPGPFDVELGYVGLLFGRSIDLQVARLVGSRLALANRFSGTRVLGR